MYLTPPPSASSIKNLSESASVIASPFVVLSISIASPSTFPAVVIVASLLSAIAAEPFISALTITPVPIAATPEVFIDRSPEITTGL